MAGLDPAIQRDAKTGADEIGAPPLGPCVFELWLIVCREADRWVPGGERRKRAWSPPDCFFHLNS